MRRAGKTEDLSFEPSLRETLADPVIRAVMSRDGVSEDDLLRLIRAARARLLPPREPDAPRHDAPAHDAVVMPFPVRPARAARMPETLPRMPEAPGRVPEAEAPKSADAAGAELRPRTRWPFYVRQSVGTPAAPGSLAPDSLVVEE